MVAEDHRPHIYDGDGDKLMRKEFESEVERIVLTPDALPSRTPDPTPRIRIMWGQHLLEDLLAGRYRSLVCAVNAEDNSRGIIAQLAKLLPTSQWDQPSITLYARQFANAGAKSKVLKYDMDRVEVLAILRPANHPHLTVEDLSAAFKIASQMVNGNALRQPSASVSFLEGHANALVDASGAEPSFETVLRMMYEAGYHGDVYPSPSMWHVGPVGLFPRYPFGAALESLRGGGY